LNEYEKVYLWYYRQDKDDPELDLLYNIIYQSGSPCIYVYSIRKIHI
jgi:hypothetical protein